jgi:hypothetical protein
MCKLQSLWVLGIKISLSWLVLPLSVSLPPIGLGLMPEKVHKGSFKQMHIRAAEN